jgi:hypothetical protein
MGVVRQSYKGRANRIKVNNDSKNVEVKVTSTIRRPLMFSVSSDKDVTVKS